MTSDPDEEQRQADEQLAEPRSFEAVGADERRRKIESLESFKTALGEYSNRGTLVVGDPRASINKSVAHVQQILLGICALKPLTIAPPQSVGGMVLRGIDPFDYLFDHSYGPWVREYVVGTVERAIGVLSTPPYTLCRVQKKELTSGPPSRRIFIVHGHDTTVKEQLARFLTALGLEPVILHEQPNRGQTIIEKLEAESGQAGFAFVLLTPDDVGSAAGEPASALRARARQNVVFEFGLFAGKFGRGRVCAIHRGDLELPSDLQGIVYEPIVAGAPLDSIAFRLVGELRAAGYDVDANRLYT